MDRLYTARTTRRRTLKFSFFLVFYESTERIFFEITTGMRFNILGRIHTVVLVRSQSDLSYSCIRYIHIFIIGPVGLNLLIVSYIKIV